MQIRETEIRTYRDGVVPLSVLSGDMGGFRETFAPRAFAKTLQERREIAADVRRAPHGFRFSAEPVSVAFHVIRDQWKQHRRTGDLVRELVEVRLVGISEPQPARISSRAAAIAAGVRADFANGKLA